MNDSLTLDSSYKLSESWKFTGYWTHSENRWNVDKASLGEDTHNMTDTLGFGVKAQLAAHLSAGVDISASNDVTSFTNVVTGSTADANGNIVGINGTRTPAGNYLPTINYNTTKINLFGIYDLDKKSYVRANLIYQEFRTDDWQWGYNGVPFLYSDNTTVSNPNQILTFLGVSYVHKF